jgi:hypothetical protein
MTVRTLSDGLSKVGCVLVRHGGRHDWWRNPRTGAAQPVLRYREVNENVAKHILKKLSV